MKTSELIGPALDWAVATCEGVPALHIVKKPEKTCVYGEVMGIDFPYQPSTDWSQGGPIIERKAINVSVSLTAPWMGFIYDGAEMVSLMDGPTPLIAAMRAFVASRLGDEVEIPSELQP